MEKRADERETEKQQTAAAAAAAAGTPDAKKRRSGSPSTTDGASASGPGGTAGLCDDVMDNILARVPTRTAVASMALSTRHRRLIRSTEFRSLHCRLAPPLPRPYIAFLVTATVRTRPDGKDEVPVSAFQGFHVAGAGGFNGNAPAPVRALAGRRFVDVGYVNTCNGVVLLAGAKYSARSRCVLWNPAVADVVEEVSIPDADADVHASTGVTEYRALGLGYGRRSKTYKLTLLCRRRKEAAVEEDGITRYYYSLVTYAVGADPGNGKQKQPTEIELPADTAIGQHSLYMDDRIYLLNRNPEAILAFDVDDETVASMDLPMARYPNGYAFTSTSRLMECSGRPCVVTEYGGGCAVWLLSVDHQWQRRCLIGQPRSGHIYPHLIVGAWDCGGVLVLCFKDDIYSADGRLYLYDLTTSKMFVANLDSVVTLKSSDLALCWGYRPTLEAPSDVVGKLQQDEDRCLECSTCIMKALKPVAEQDMRKGQEATLNTVCFMDFLVRIMQKLPKDLKQVLEMKMMDSDDLTFENVLFKD